MNKRLPAGSFPPPSTQSLSSLSNTQGSITIPSPRTSPQSSLVIPDGKRWNFSTLSPRTTVCPALLPPWNLATQVAFSASLSTSLPLPSSPHWAPKTTVAGMMFRCLSANRVHELCARLGMYAGIGFEGKP